MRIKNTKRAAKKLARKLVKDKLIPVFDLDGVVLDASHRQICNPDGSLNLKEYRKHSTRENILKDKTMPLINTIEILNDLGVKYHVCTARVACKNTLELLERKGIRPVTTMARQGESDHRKDYVLKGAHLTKKFSTRKRSKMVLIDDNEQNCKMARAIGMSSIHVPFKGH